jgi:uncharacterized membrane protein
MRQDGRMRGATQRAPGSKAGKAVPGWTGWVSMPVALAATAGTFLLGWLQKLPCHSAGWPYDWQLMFGRRCYSDLPVLYTARGLAQGIFPYAPEAGNGLEYPVVTGVVMDLTARLSRWLTAGSDPLAPAAIQTFVELTALLLLCCALIAVWATANTRGRPVDGLLVAIAPTLALTGTINWDLLAVAATALAVLAWARERPALAGALLGLGAAAKLYPVLLLGPIVVLALRAGAPRRALRAVGAAAVTWVAVNLPIAIAYPAGWAEFWRFNAHRPAEFGSVWYALGLLGHPVGALNPIAIGLFAVAAAGIGVLAMKAPRPPSLAALGFLTVAAFVVTNKVYSPQYVLWLLPLAVLARPSIVELLAWQAAEVYYWWSVWGYLGTGLVGHYPAATFLRIGATLWLAARVVWQILHPPVQCEPQPCACSLRQVEPSAEYAA